LNEEFVGGDTRDGECFEAQIIYAAINDGAHGFWQCRHGGMVAANCGIRQTLTKGGGNRAAISPPESAKAGRMEGKALKIIRSVA
jgi:hypothetical protein